MRSTITLAGNLGREPEVRFTSSGTAVCTFTVAVGSRKKNVAGEWEDGPTSWYDCVAFNQLAEDIAASSITKGSKVVVTGTLSVEDWTTKDGKDRRSVKVAVDEVGVSVRQSKATREHSAAADDPWATQQPPF